MQAIAGIAVRRSRVFMTAILLPSRKTRFAIDEDLDKGSWGPLGFATLSVAESGEWLGVAGVAGSPREYLAYLRASRRLQAAG
jgi:hypothetical protein